jgi:hypothetical protein
MLGKEFKKLIVQPIDNHNLNFIFKSIIVILSLQINASLVATVSVVEGLESMTCNPVTSLAWVRSPGDAFVV